MRNILLLITLFLGSCANTAQEEYTVIDTYVMDDLPSQESVTVLLERYDVPNTNIWAKKERIIDSLGPDNDGAYVYYYEYDVYYFTSEKHSVSARTYIDSLSEASFRRLEVNGEKRFLEKDDFELPFMRDVVDYLKSEGKTNLMWLDTENSNNGYSVVPVTN